MTTSIFKGRLMPLLLAASFGAATAAPTSPTVVAGQATFNQQGNVFSITNTPGTIINWHSFSVGAGEITRFIQQNADSAVLNRITGQDPSRILGALQSNGKVFLINPNGILFGRDSRVDVNGLVASTLNISNADFLAGKKNFSGGGAGDVRNEGAITTPSGGQVFLVAPNVANTGLITSPQGDVVLAAGHSVQLVDSRDPNMHVVLSAPENQAINLGQVVAQGGRIGIYGALVNQRGLVSANSAVVGENGKIVFKASRDTVLEQGSVTSATGAGKGGEIALLGGRVGLAGNAAVDASGAAGGGTVLVGGDYQGKNAALPNARHTWFGKDASIKADATASGDGGTVVLWSDGATAAYGSISARGGAGGGNGGLVETSGHDLDVAGVSVNASAAKGKAGTWLLDPYDIEVVSTGTASPADVATFSGGPATGVTKIAPSVLTSTGTDIVLQAQHDLTFTDALAASRNVRGQAGNNINVNNSVTSNGGSIDLRAGSQLNLTATALLASSQAVDLKADQMVLNGNIRGMGALPLVSFTTSTDSRPITVRSGTAAPTELSLDAAALNTRVQASQISIGNSNHTGAISINSAISTGANVALDNAGSINIHAPISANHFAASLFGWSPGLINVGVDGAVNATGSVLLQGDGMQLAGVVRAPSVRVMPHNASTLLTLGGSGGSGILNLSQSSLEKIAANELTIGGQIGQMAPVQVAGAVDFSKMAAVPATVTLDAGDSFLEMSAPLKTSGTLVLKSSNGIYQIDAGAVSADKLLVKGGQVILTGDNRIGTIAGSTAGSLFHVNAGAGFAVGDVGGMSGISADNGWVQLTSSGAINFDSPVTVGENHLSVRATSLGGAAPLKANSIDLATQGSVGSASAPLNTQASLLLVHNTQSGSNPINIRNTGNLVLGAARQEGEANTGGISISTTGSMAVVSFSTSETRSAASSTSAAGSTTTATATSVASGVRTSSGDISLQANGMTVSGEIRTNSGNVRLDAGSAGKFATTDKAVVASATGDIYVSAATTEIATGTLQAADGKLHLPGTVVTPPPPPPPAPTVEACLATPALSGCGPVLEQAKKACIADPSGQHCPKLLPPVSDCKANPTAPGCDAVLQREAVLQCIANPKAQGCDSVLPAYETCATKPGTLGCDTVVQQRKEIDACLATPKAGSCPTVLPDYPTCSAKPNTYGCGPAIEEHNKIAACIANPKASGCADTLPPLATCQANGSVFGCEPVLARAKFDACLVNPGAPGCDSVLPAPAVCKVTPSAEGCDVVIKKTFTSCLANPHDPVCNGILPTLAQCVANKSLDGCAVVLPTMTQCIGSPSLQGCSVVLPKLEQCAVNPNQAGCEAVLPKPDFCSTHPTDPTCAPLNPGTGSGNEEKKPVTEAVNTTVTLINRTSGSDSGSSAATKAPAPAPAGGTSQPGSDSSSNSSGDSGDKPAEKESGPAPSENNGAKNDKPIPKNYCN